MALWGDPIRLGQTLLNLVRNAIKFTDTGGIDVRLLPVLAEGDRVRLTFEVRDTGIGILPEDHQRIFLPFEQVDGSSTRSYGGTGLGLYLCKKLAQRMGGDISLESQIGIGSIFRFHATATVAADGHENGSGAIACNHINELKSKFFGSSVLVVEDEPISQEIIKELLASVGLLVIAVRDGKEAVAAVHECQFDLILMDLKMPNMDGIEATYVIRESSHHQHTPIVAITANAFTEDREECMRAGMNDYIAKPVAADRLYAMALKWLGNAKPKSREHS